MMVTKIRFLELAHIASAVVVIVLSTAVSAKAEEKTNLIDKFNGASPLTFKGISLGASVERWKEVFPTARCFEDNKKIADTTCSLETEFYFNCKIPSVTDYKTCVEDTHRVATFAEKRINWIYALFNNEDGLGKISFSTDSQDFEFLLDVLTEKYGKPSQKKSREINEKGISYQRMVTSWKQGETELYLINSISGGKDGQMTLINKSFEKEIARREKIYKNKVKADM